MQDDVPNDLNIKFMPLSCNQSLYDSSFAVMGPRLWNILPSHSHRIKEPQQFKIKLKQSL